MEHTARLKRIMQDRIPALVDAIKSRESKNLSAESCLIAFSNADPTRNKTAVEWMIRAYSNGQFLLEDLEGGSQSTISETLKLFGAYRKNYLLPREISTLMMGLGLYGMLLKTIFQKMVWMPHHVKERS